MTAIAAPAASTIPASAFTVSALPHVLEAARCMSRAQERVGTRSGAWDLLDVAAALETALPLLRGELRARFGEIPLLLRVELSTLARGAERAEELGRRLSSVVTSDVPSPGSIAMHLDEWKRAVTVLAVELEAAR